MASLSSLLLSNPHRSLRPSTNPSTTFNFTFFHPEPKSSIFLQTPRETPNSPPTRRRHNHHRMRRRSHLRWAPGSSSWALRCASGDSKSVEVTMFNETEGDSVRGSFFWRRRKEGIASVVEDLVQPEVLWEQSLKDVEAERGRKTVTSTGFSFSAAGLLFPYHLMEKGYIKDTTPLAGSSAGAIVCAVIAFGASMDEALQATKILAEDCRLTGTAFRLGVCVYSIMPYAWMRIRKFVG